MSEWRVEKEPRLDLYRVTDGERTLPSSMLLEEAEGWAAYLNNLEQYKALAERMRAVYGDTLFKPEWEALKAQEEAGQ